MSIGSCSESMSTRCESRILKDKLQGIIHGVLPLESLGV